MPKKTRTRIFKQGKTAVNINDDIYKKIKDESLERQLYPSQVVNEILKKHYNKEENCGTI